MKSPDEFRARPEIPRTISLLGFVSSFTDGSSELVIHAGFRRAGWIGFAVGGVLFILPASAPLPRSCVDSLGHRDETQKRSRRLLF